MAVGQDNPSGDRGARTTGQYSRVLSSTRGRGAGLILLALVLGSCGYRFSVAEGRLPDGQRSICIPLADSRSAEPWVAAFLTKSLRLAAHGAGLKLVEPDSAPRLKALIASVDAVPRAVAVAGGRYRTREQEIMVRSEFEIVLTDGSEWRQSFTRRRSYLSAPDIRGTEANRQMAVRALLKDLAAEVVGRLSRGFKD